MTKLATMLVIAAAIPVASGAEDNLKAAIQRYFVPVRRNLEAAAEAMPAAKYDFRLSGGQMTFAEWLNHSTERNYADCAALKGEAVPDGAKKAAALKEKAEVGQALRDSFAYCASALEHLGEDKVLASPQLTYTLLHIAVHNNEIYGNLAGYLRVSGIVPPSTASRAPRASTPRVASAPPTRSKRCSARP